MRSVASLSHLNNDLQPSMLDNYFFNKVIHVFKDITHGRLILTIEQERYEFGDSADDCNLTAYVHVNSKAMFRNLALNGIVGAGEMYMLGAWQSPDLVKVVTLLSRNIDLINQIDDQKNILKKISSQLYALIKQNTLSGSKRNISAHYDLSNDFFSLFLDKTMMYSAAIYPSRQATLAEAAVHKLDVTCRKLELCEDDHLIEIGTGWGGMAVHAAKYYGCKVTTTTISNEQYDYACQQVIAHKLEDKVTVLKEDYRNLTGKYDKLVSIEMIEAVGHQFYQSYFEKCSSLLKEDGLALIQSITISDQRFDQAKNSVDFIQRYIFPGGCLPSVSVIADCVAKHTDMQIADLQDISSDYARTLSHWREAFHANLAAVKQMGFDEVFCRMWDFYLCYCEGGFNARIIQTSQILMSKPQSDFSRCSV